jgi:hypothetical protein
VHTTRTLMATAKKRCREEHPRRNCPALFYARPIIISIISLISRPPACKVCPSLDLIKKTTALTDQTLQLCGEMMPLVSSLAMLSNDGKHLSSNDAEPVHEKNREKRWSLASMPSRAGIQISEGGRSRKPAYIPPGALLRYL